MRSMVRAVVVVAVLVAACGSNDHSAPPDAPPTPPDAPIGSIHRPAGASCSSAESYWCADYEGVCIDGVCRLQCGDGGQPRCEPGSAPQIRDFGAWQQCYCVPG